MFPKRTSTNQTGANGQGGGSPHVGRHTAAGAAVAAGVELPKRGYFGAAKALFRIGQAREPLPVTVQAALATRAGRRETDAQKIRREKIEADVAKQKQDDLRPHFGMVNVKKDKFSPVSTLAKSSSAPGAGATPAVITDAGTGLLRKDRTLKFLDGLELELIDVCAKARRDREITPGDRAKLLKQFDALKKALEKTKASCKAGEENGHKVLRDYFAETNAICKKIVTITEKAQPAPRFIGMEKHDSALPKLNIYFNDLAQLSVELKRFHHTHNVSFAIEDHARATVDAMAKAAPGLILARTGSDLTTSKEICFGLKQLKLHGLADIGCAGNLRYQRGNKWYIDDDMEFVVLNTQRTQLDGGAYFKFGKLIRHGEGSHMFNLGLTGRVSHTTGSYYDHTEPLSAVKASLQRTSDSNYWSLLCRSADPAVLSNRIFAAAGRIRNGFANNVFGAIYTPVVGMPNLNQRKLNKGAYNNAKVMELGNRFGGALPAPRGGALESKIAALVLGAYAPVVSLEMDEDRLCKADKDGIVAPSIYNPLIKTSPLPSPFNRKSGKSNRSISRKTIGFDAVASVTSLDYADSQPGQMRAGASASLGGEYSWNTINFQRVKSAHEQLDPAYNKDIGTSHRLLRQLATTHHGEPKLHTFNAIEHMLGDKVWEWRDDVQVASARRLENAENALAHVDGIYRRFIDVASQQAALQDKVYRKGLPDFGRKADADFDALVKDLFGIGKFANSTQRRFVQSLRENPEKFMCEGYDALSITLGKVGVHLFETKKQVNLRCDENHPGAEALWKDMQELDVKFTSVRRLMDGIFLPISQEKLFRSSSIISTADSINTTSNNSTEFFAGMWNSPAQYLPDNASDPTSPTRVGAKPGWVSIARNASVGGKAVTGTRNADAHPNPVRCGSYRLSSFSVKGGGLAALLVGGGMRAWFKQCEPKFTAGGADAPKAPAQSALCQIFKTAARMGMGSYTNEIIVDTGTRTPKSVGKFKYETSSQYIRLSTKKTMEVGATVAIPTPILMTIGASLGVSQAVADVVVETMGPCPAYHILQFPKMKGMLDECRYDTAKAADKKTGQTGKGANLSTLEDVDFKKLRNLLIPKTTSDYVRCRTVDREYILNKYFGTDEAIIGFLEKFMRYSQTRREVGKDPVEFDGPRTEFHRFDDDPSFFNIAQTMGESNKYAPGSLLNTSTGYAKTREQFRKGASNDGRPTLGDNAAAVQKAIDAVKLLLLQIKDATPEQRAEIFLGGSETSPGRFLFQTYIMVVSGYQIFHNAIKPTCTYREEVAKK